MPKSEFCRKKSYFASKINAMIYRIRATAATGGDQVFRDLEVSDENNLEDLHNIIQQSFGLEGNELASFYTTDDELNLIDEIPLFAMDEGLRARTMANTLLKDVLNREQPKLIYVYDYLNMWQFLIELLEEGPEAPGAGYPRLVYSYGQLPEQPPEPEFDIENLNEEFDEGGREWDEEDPFGDFYDLNDDEW